MQHTTSQVHSSHSVHQNTHRFRYCADNDILQLHLNFRYEAIYAKDIPEVITGDAFLKKYGDHDDTVTAIDPKRSYNVKAPTRHPIYENFRVEVRSLHLDYLLLMQLFFFS